MPEERKLVTILFADVTESTALGDTLDPEDVRALMGRYYAHARRIIQEHGGTLEKFIGDAVMAVFGLPHAYGNDAERALAGALALREAVATDTVLDRRLLLRIGINTGEIIATSDPQGGDFLATGDAVNVAARLQQAASPGEIVVSERTADAAQAAFLFDNARLVEVKGKRQPLRVFPLQEARLVRRVTRPPFVGRRQDLLQLSVLQARVLEERRPQLVSILAPAGIGKTRLLEEFLARLDQADGFQVATARCLPYGQTLTYWPLRGLLTDLLGGEIAKPPSRRPLPVGAIPLRMQRVWPISSSRHWALSAKGQATARAFSMPGGCSWNRLRVRRHASWSLRAFTGQARAYSTWLSTSCTHARRFLSSSSFSVAQNSWNGVPPGVEAGRTSPPSHWNP